MTEEYIKLKEAILSNKTFVITTHINPDGDAIGSETALYFALKKLGRQARIINCSQTPYFLEFLDKDNVIEIYNEEIHDVIIQNAEVLIALDFNNPSRIGKMGQALISAKNIKVCIDHHQRPDDFAEIQVINPEFAATGHILYDFFEKTGITEIDSNMAVGLYAAIMTDTGSFRFDRTTPELHMIIAGLIKHGADPTAIYNNIFDNNRYGKLRLLGEALSEIKTNSSGTIAYMKVTQEALQRTGTDEAEVDGFVNFCLSISGVKIGMLFFELKDGIKISFRSKGKIPVNRLAEEFNGGGHTNAAGARIDDTQMNGVVDSVLEAAEKYLAGH